MRKGFFLDLLNTIGLIILLFTEPRLGRGGWNSTIITFGIFIMVQIIFNAGMKIWQEKELRGNQISALRIHFYLYLLISLITIICGMIWAPEKLNIIFIWSFLSLALSAVYMFYNKKKNSGSSGM